MLQDLAIWLRTTLPLRSDWRLEQKLASCHGLRAEWPWTNLLGNRGYASQRLTSRVNSEAGVPSARLIGVFLTNMPTTRRILHC